MPKAETTFEPIGSSDSRMHGETAILASGYSVSQQKTLRAMMDTAGLQDVGVVYIVAESLPLTLKELARLPAESNAGKTAELPQAVVMSGLTEKQLHAMMDNYRESSLPRPLWASVTPTSANWTIKYLLVELLKEREAMRQARQAQLEKEAAQSEGSTS
jgi:hypothetical protein